MGRRIMSDVASRQYQGSRRGGRSYRGTFEQDGMSAGYVGEST